MNDQRQTLLLALRCATEDDVAVALERSLVALPITTPVEALELINCILDEITGEAARAHGCETGEQSIFAHWPGDG